MTGKDVEAIRAELAAWSDRCDERRREVWDHIDRLRDRVGALEIGMGRIGLQAATLVAIAALIGSAIATAIVSLAVRAIAQ